MTYSIVAIDPDTKTLGIAVASGSMAVATRVPWIREGVGAIATQAYTNIMYGADGLELLEKGMSPQQVLETLLRKDSEPEKRQVAIIDINNMKAVHTGVMCPDWKGEIIGDNYVIIGNLIVGKNVLLEAERAFLRSGGSIVDKLIRALVAGEKAGGDKRGNRSAGIVIRGEVNIVERIDDDSNPAEKLFMRLKDTYFR